MLHRDGERTPLPGQHPLATDKEACAPQICSVLLVFGDQTKEPMPFVRDSGGEVNAVAERKKIPQAVKLQRSAIGAHEGLDKGAGGRVVNVNQSITEVADPKFAVHERESPWSIEVAV